MDWKLIALVGAGGALGSMARYAIHTTMPRTEFPLATFMVNVVGCFLLGVLVFGGESTGGVSPQAHAVLGVGVLGGFTTMSAFGVETTALLLDAQRATTAVAYILATLAACVGATLLGRAAGLTLWPTG
jgi:fluoride exporter